MRGSVPKSIIELMLLVVPELCPARVSGTTDFRRQSRYVLVVTTTAGQGPTHLRDGISRAGDVDIRFWAGPPAQPCLFVKSRPVLVGLIDVAGDIPGPRLLHGLAVVEIELAVDDLPRLRIN
jgi:hypothetical protein